MATYLKRTSKLFDISLARSSGEVNLRDLICPVCRGILIEPVTLPCTHNLCLRCLKGTFEHNSLSCPLCRVRVGSWLRNATKSETLVNNVLWDLIRTRFPNEVERKDNGDERDIDPDSGFATKKIILSAAGEIRREYEAQLQLAEEEMRRRRESERLANEALIRKIHDEEQKEKLSQLASDQLLAKNIVKKQLLNKDKSAIKFDETKNNFRPSERERAKELNSEKMGNFENGENEVLEVRRKVREGEKVKAEKVNLPHTISLSEEQETSYQKAGNNCQVVSKSLKSQAIAKSCRESKNYSSEPSCSGTQIFGWRNREELQVPTDLIRAKGKILEICVSQTESDERIGSAESAASHDSINQEIHHFKPIDPMARTTLKVAHDGRPIDPKLIRVIPILKRVSNAVPKAPSTAHFKRILGCSWSAFRGKARQSLEQRQSPENSEPEAEVSKVEERSKRLEPEVSYDANKNYARLNGTRLNKKLIVEEKLEKVGWRSRKIARKSEKIKGRVRNVRNVKKQNSSRENEENETGNSSPEVLTRGNLRNDKLEENTIENIAERIKRRKIVEDAKKMNSEVNNGTRRKTRGNSKEEEKVTEKVSGRKRKINAKNNNEDEEESDKETVNEAKVVLERMQEKRAEDKKGQRAKKKIVEKKWQAGKSWITVEKSGKNGRNGNSKSLETGKLNDSLPQDEESLESLESGEKVDESMDKRIIEEQTRIELLIEQEKKDFELARRLQAHFDGERVTRRTRGSRRALENFDLVLETETNTANECLLENKTSTGKRKKSSKTILE